MKNITEKTVESVSKLKFFYNCTCRKDSAKFLNAFEMSDEKFAQQACKLFKIEPASTILQTAKTLLKEVQNGKSQKKTSSQSDSVVSRNEKKKTSKINTHESETSVETSNSNTGNSSKSNLVFKIDRDIEKLVPKATAKQFALIKKSFEEHGFREDGDFIEVLKDGTIVDGHTRYRVCKELGIEIPENAIKIIDENIENVIKIKNIARRHLSNLKKIELVKDELAEIERQLGKGRTAREQKAKTAGVSQSDIQQVEFMEKWASDRLEAVHNEEEHFNTAFKDVKEKYNKVKEIKAELLTQIEEGDLDLEEAVEQVKQLQKKPKKQKRDPVCVEFLMLKEFSTRMIKKYNKNKFQIDDNPEGRVLKEILDWVDNTIKKFGGE